MALSSERRREMSCLFKALTEEHLTTLFIYLVYFFPVLTHYSVSRWKWLEAEAMNFDQWSPPTANDFLRKEEGNWKMLFLLMISFLLFQVFQVKLICAS